MLSWRGVKKKFNSFCYKYVPVIMNTVIPIWYIFCTMALNHLACTHIFDYLHGEGTVLSHVCKILIIFLSSEMMINWVFLSKVKSNYENTDENNKKRVEHEKKFPQFISEGVAYEQLQERRPALGTGNWSVVTQYTGSEVKRTAYPYWGWKPCVVCSHYKPPRCHHCPICNVCVLKRDHHCFFARQCVGLRNQRYFVVFNFWAVLVNIFFIPQFCYYIIMVLWPEMEIYDLFLPFTLINYAAGGISSYILLVMFHIYSLVYFFLLALVFLIEQVRCVDKGMTSYELEHRNYHIKSQCKSRYERFTCVFGRNNIWINLLIPYHWASEPVDDGITWQSMKKD